MTSKYYHIMAALAEAVENKTGEKVFLRKMDQVTNTLPSKEAQYSNLGMRMGRQKMTQDRQAVQRRKSVLRTNQVAPSTDPQVSEALEKLGMSNMAVETEEDQRRVMKLIRAMPRNMSIKREMRAMLMNGPVKHTKGCKYILKNKWNSFKISWNEFRYSLEVWRSSLKKVEGHQGMGAVSYFVFLRWLFFLNIFIFLLLFWVVTFFHVAFESTSEYDNDLTGGVYATSVASTCSALYSANVSSDALTLILDFFQGTGWMEDTAMFHGYYTDKKLQLAASNYNMPLAYFLVTVVVMIISLVVMVRSTLSNFKDTVLTKERGTQANYCNMVFAGLDYSIDEDEAMPLKQKSMYSAMVAELDDQRHELDSLNRTSGEKCKIYTIRFFINFLILIMLGGAGAAIYYAQDYSSEFTTDPDVQDKYHQLVILLVQFLPSIVIGLLNGIYPLIFGILVTFENYRPAFVIKISLIRMVFLKLASLAMVVASLYVQITCSDKTSCNVGQNSCPSIMCWETYVGSAVYKLVIMDLLINTGVTLGVELPRKLITTKCDCGIAKKVGPAVFDIPKNVLDLVYAQTLLWLGFYFSPLLPAVSVMAFFLTFYLKYLSAMYNTVPPEKPYQASKSNSFFTIILMVAFFMICIPVGYTLSNMQPSVMCGPFRIYDAPSNIITVQINNGEDWFQTIWNIVTSSAVVSAALILLILLVYYCSALKSAHKDLVDMMKEQLVLEGKDKQYLLARIAELSGEAPKKKPPPYQRSQLKTVDETAPQAKTPPTKNGNLSMENQAINLYGSEPSIIYTPSSKAPAPANYNAPLTPADVNGGFLPNTPDTSGQTTSKQKPTSLHPVDVEPQREAPHSAMDDW